MTMHLSHLSFYEIMAVHASMQDHFQTWSIFRNAVREYWELYREKTDRNQGPPDDDEWGEHYVDYQCILLDDLQYRLGSERQPYNTLTVVEQGWDALDKQELKLGGL